MVQEKYSVFDTPIGCCGIAWSENGDAFARPAVTRFQLPEATEKQTETRIARNTAAQGSAAPPPRIAAIIERVRKHLQGELQDFRDIPLDLRAVGPFAQRVYEAAQQIPAGETRTYGELAQALKLPTAAQAVGQALANNPIPLLIPCHRVLAARGRPGGFSAPGGRATKARLLEIEGSNFGPDRTTLSFNFERAANSG